MAWVSPITWASALVTVAQFNEQIRDNMLALKDPPTDLYTVNEGTDYTTSNTSFANVDGTDLALTITTTGGDVLITFHGSVVNAGGRVHFDVFESVTAALVGGDDGIIELNPATVSAVSFAFWVQGLSAGSHTFTLRWKVSAGTATMYSGAGTSGHDTHPQFAIREVS